MAEKNMNRSQSGDRNKPPDGNRSQSGDRKKPPNGNRPAAENQWLPASTSSKADSTIAANSYTHDLSGELSSSALYAFPALIAIILKLDFDEKENESFRRKTIDTILVNLKLPPQACRSVKEHLEVNGNASTDVVPLIGMLRKDPLINKNSALILPAHLVALFATTGVYDSRIRVLLRHCCALLSVNWDKVELVEMDVTHLLENQNYDESEEAKKLRQKSEKTKKYKRYAMIGASGAVGGVLIGLTGGLAAPFIAAGAGVIVGGAAAGIATTAGAAVLGSLFGVAGAGLAGYKMNKRVGAIEEFIVEPIKEEQERCLHCAICVSGWISEERADAFTYPWRHLLISREQYSLRYESRYLVQLGKAMDYLMSFAVSYGIQQTLMQTAFAGLMSAIAWPVAILSIGSVIDNPWNVCVRRSAEVGHHLSDLLLARQHGQRPVTLVGFSLGARVIYHCLQQMAQRPDCYGIVEDVILLGAPVAASRKQWRNMCAVVGGRIINGYCETDWLLKFLYRTMNAQMSIAGIQPVDKTGEKKIYNVNLSHIVKGHMDYETYLPEILEAVGVKVAPRSKPVSFYTLSDACNATKKNCTKEELDKKLNEVKQIEAKNREAKHLNCDSNSN